MNEALKAAASYAVRGERHIIEPYGGKRDHIRSISKTYVPPQFVPDMYNVSEAQNDVVASALFEGRKA